MSLTRLNRIDWGRTVDTTDVALSVAAVFFGTILGIVIATVLR